MAQQYADDTVDSDGLFLRVGSASAGDALWNRDPFDLDRPQRDVFGTVTQTASQKRHQGQDFRTAGWETAVILSRAKDDRFGTVIVTGSDKRAAGEERRSSARPSPFDREFSSGRMRTVTPPPR